jgi:hypothetical protein
VWFLISSNIMHFLSSCFMFFNFFFLWTPCICHLHVLCFFSFFEDHAFVIFMLHGFYLFIYSFLWMPCIRDLHVSSFLFIYSFLWTPCNWGGGPNTWHNWLILFGCPSYDNVKYDN